jgi:general secretion pathway protein L
MTGSAAGGARARLVFLRRDETSPLVWLVEHGRVAGRGPCLDDLPDDLPIVAAVPGEAVLCRWLDLPVGREAQTATAAAVLLEDELAQPREQLHVALGPRADGRRLAVVVDRMRMQAWMEALAGLPRLDAVVPDCLLVPAPDTGETLAVRFADSWLVRGTEVAAAVEPDLLPLVSGEVAKVEDAADAEALIVAGLEKPAIDLRQGLFAPSRARAGAGLRAPGVAAALLALAVLSLPAVEAARFALARRSVATELSALSGVSDGAEAAARLQARLTRLEAVERFPAQAAAVMAAVERVDGMELQSLTYDQQGVIRVTAAHANYSDVELLRSTLGRSGLSVQETSAAPADGRIVSDLVLRPR